MPGKERFEKPSSPTQKRRERRGEQETPKNDSPPREQEAMVSGKEKKEKSAPQGTPINESSDDQITQTAAQVVAEVLKQQSEEQPMAADRIEEVINKFAKEAGLSGEKREQLEQTVKETLAGIKETEALQTIMESLLLTAEEERLRKHVGRLKAQFAQFLEKVEIFLQKTGMLSLSKEELKDAALSQKSKLLKSTLQKLVKVCRLTRKIHDSERLQKWEEALEGTLAKIQRLEEKIKATEERCQALKKQHQKEEQLRKEFGGYSFEEVTAHLAAVNWEIQEGEKRLRETKDEKEKKAIKNKLQALVKKRTQLWATREAIKEKAYEAALLVPEISGSLLKFKAWLEQLRSDIKYAGGIVALGSLRRELIETGRKFVEEVKKAESHLPEPLRGGVSAWMEDAIFEVLIETGEKFTIPKGKEVDWVVRMAILLRQLLAAPESISASPVWTRFVEQLSSWIENAQAREARELWGSLRKLLAIKSTVASPKEAQEALKGSGITPTDIAHILRAPYFNSAFVTLKAQLENPQSALRQAKNEEEFTNVLEQIAQQLIEQGKIEVPEGIETDQEKRNFAEGVLETAADIFGFFYLEEFAKINPVGMRKAFCFADWVKNLGDFGRRLSEVFRVCYFHDEEGKEIGPRIHLGVKPFEYYLLEKKGIEGIRGLVNWAKQTKGWEVKIKKGRFLYDWKGNRIDKRSVVVEIRNQDGKALVVEYIRYPLPGGEKRDPTKDQVSIVSISTSQDGEGKRGISPEELAVLLEGLGDHFFWDNWAKDLSYAEDVRLALVAETDLIARPPGTLPADFERELTARLEVIRPKINHLLERATNQLPPWVFSKEDFFASYLKATANYAFEPRARRVFKAYGLHPHWIVDVILNQAANRGLIEDEAQKRIAENIWGKGTSGELKRWLITKADFLVGTFWRDWVVRGFLLWGWLMFFLKTLLGVALSEAELEELQKALG